MPWAGVQFGIGRATLEVSSFLKGLIVFEGKHHHGLFAVAGDDQSFVVLAVLTAVDFRINLAST